MSRALVALLSALGAAGPLAAGCGVDDALVGGTCRAGYTQCGLRCVKLSSDSDNCGNCGRVCLSPAACTDGVCCSSADGLAADATDETPLADSSPGDDGAVEATPDQLGSGDDASSIADSPGDAVHEPTLDEPEDDLGDDGPIPVDSSQAVGAADSESDGGPDSEAASSDGSNAADSEVFDSTLDAYPEGSPPDASSAGDFDVGNPCMAPLAYCGGSCVDVTGDPLNCGGCNVVCASQLCSGGACVGAASGGIVYIGHDYTTTLPGTAQARVLANAVFVPSSNPLHVLSYERYASASAVTQVDAILTGVARQEGRTLAIASATNDDEVLDQLAVTSFDVMLVHDQPSASDGGLAALGANWASTLSLFALGGGVIIVLDGGGGIGQMPAFATATGLLGVSAHFPTPVGTPLLVVSRVDAVGVGVISPYGAGQNSVGLTTEANGGNVVYVVEVDSDAGANTPIVVHKGF